MTALLTPGRRRKLGFRKITLMGPREDKAPDDQSNDADSTLHLLTAVRAGDEDALDRLFARYVPELRAVGQRPSAALGARHQRHA